MYFVFMAASVASVAQKRHVVFVIADGIPADVLEKAAAPNLKAIAKAVNCWVQPPPSH